MPGTVWRIRIFLASWLAYACFYLCRRNFSVIMPYLLVDQGFSTIDLANVIFAFSVAYAAGQFAMGALVDRFGPIIVVTLGMIVSAVSMGSMGAFAGVQSSLVLEAINGLAQASGWPGLAKLVGSSFGRDRRGVTMAWWSTNYVAGGFLATMITTYVTTLHWLRWPPQRSGTVIPAGLLFVAAIGFYWQVRKYPVVFHGLDSSKEMLETGCGVRAVLGDATLRCLGCAYFCVKLIRYSLLFWLPAYLVQEARVTTAGAGYISSIFELAGVTGVLATGYLSDKVFQARCFPAGALMLLCLGAACLLQGWLSSKGIATAGLGIALLGFFTFGPDSLLVGAGAQDASSMRTMGITVGAVDGFGSIGQLLSRYIVAAVVAAFSWDNLLIGFAVLAWLATAILLWGSRLESRASPAGPVEAPVPTAARARVLR